jgi:hypothetical protein
MMTANELADLLMYFDSGQVYNHATEIANMLLQQQSEIEALRSLSLRRENLGYFYDLHASQQAEIDALKAKLQIE